VEQQTTVVVVVAVRDVPWLRRAAPRNGLKEVIGLSMNRYQIGFEFPWYLLLLMLLPILWWWSFSRLSSLGGFRRIAALLLRSLIFTALIFALAGIQWKKTSEKVSVIYVLDQSDSIPLAKRDLMLAFVRQSSEQHRRTDREDRAGMIVFGKDAAIEIQPFDDTLPLLRNVESDFGGADATNLEAALKLAQASFPEDSAKRVVIVTDGLETIGNSATTVQGLAKAGIGIDVVPVKLDSTSEVLIEKIDLPTSIREGQPIEASVVLHRYQGENAKAEVEGNLRVWRRLGAQQEMLYDKDVVLDRDVNVVPIQDKITQPAGYTYEAEFTPKVKQQDALSQNNRANAFAFVRGKGRVLLIENWRTPGEYTLLVEALRRNKIEVQVQPSNQLFSSLAELQAYDCVILAGVPRTTGENASEISEFTTTQMEILVRNTEQFGCGLLMIGGPEAFGAGGWANTEIEKAMPVDFQIKNTKIEAVGALAMILHASEIPEGNYWQKVIARAAIDVLGPMDYCGIVNFDNIAKDTWLWDDGLSRVGENRTKMRARLSRMTPGDMPNFAPAMQMILTGLKSTKASVKHAIIISDGDPSAPSNALINQFAAARIKVSTVAVGAHGPAGHQILQKIAAVTGGNYYVASNPKALPKIFIREAMKVSRPLVYEPEGNVQPQISYPHEVLQGLSQPLQDVSGFVLTTVKESPLVQVAIRSPKPAEPENQSILATWNYGLGRTAVFTSDAGKRWTTKWTGWKDYDRFWSQLVRWTMRPSTEDGKFTVATQMKDGRGQIIVNALDENDRFLNFLELASVGVGPDMKPFPITMRQQAPGRYVGEFDANQAGSYMLTVSTGPGKALLTNGFTVPFSDEYRVRPINLNLLQQFAALQPKDGVPGIIGEPLEDATLENATLVDRFREGLQRALSLTDLWQWMLYVGAVLLFADVLVRRVAIEPSAVTSYLSKYWRKSAKPEDEERQRNLEVLRSRKAVVGQELEGQRASSRFEITEDVANSSSVTAELKGSEKSKTSEPSNRDKNLKMDSESEEGYTSRLLAAKKAAQKSKKDKP
jgi:uncharacterized membrane protein